MLVLGIESSCDETAAAVVRGGREILSSVISSQIPLHCEWGGVVPEIASREHLEKIEPIVAEAMQCAGVEFADLDAIAVTNGPGLIGSLLVGVCYAKALAFALGKPFVGVNHIEGHIFSVNFENPAVVFPALALIVSGGHTNLFFMPEAGKYKIAARTRDDAAGEAFDKVAKLLGLGYPGGPIIEKLALEGNPSAVRFGLPKISDGRPDFSFSGLKTAVSKYVRENRIAPVENGAAASRQIKDLAAGFQAAAVRQLINSTEKVANELRPQTLIVAGGVACNKALREAARDLAERLQIPIYFPSPHLSTDNAAMIAAAGTFYLERGAFADLTLTADVSARLQNVEVEDAELRRQQVRYRL
jgi:N6-L-threonylcarbamoyladenine synthase